MHALTTALLVQVTVSVQVATQDTLLTTLQASVSNNAQVPNSITVLLVHVNHAPQDVLVVIQMVLATHANLATTNM